MNLNTLFTAGKGSVATVNISGKDIEVFCSSTADRALARRTMPLIVELELAFACFVRKKVHFHETSTSLNVIHVNGKLALLISTIVPDTCEITTNGHDKDSTPENEVILAGMMPGGRQLANLPCLSACIAQAGPCPLSLNSPPQAVERNTVSLREFHVKSENAATITLRNFMPKWVRVDFVKGKWVGEYGL